MSLIHRFFRSTNGMDPCLPKDYRRVRHYRDSLVAISSFNNQNFYVIDYYKQTFDFITDNPLFLCGYTKKEVTKMGFAFFEKVIPADDLKMVLEISDKAFEFFYKLPPGRRTRCFISYDFRIIHSNGASMLVNHILRPMYTTQKGYLWLALCQVSRSDSKQPGNVMITMADEMEKYEYSFPSKKFKQIEMIPLSSREKEVFNQMGLGFSVKEIASNLCIEADTIKFHKKNIFRKLGIKSRIRVMHFGNEVEGN